MGRKAVGREKGKKGAHTAADMKRGIELHQRGLSLRKSAKECNVPYPTLKRYVLKYIRDKTCSLVPNYEVNTIFNADEEKELKSYIVDCADLFYGLTSRDVRKLAYQTAKINNIKMPSSWITNKMAGKDWLLSFRQRNPGLSVKKPEACSLARATAFNKNNVKKFFDNLKQVLERHPSFGNGSRIFNLDETATTTVQRPQKILAPKGKNACKITSGERGVLITTCCIVSATGQALPPAMVFPRKKFQDHNLHGAPSGTLGLAAPSGWMNSELFVHVMRHFIQHSSASKDNPAVLIMDNHESHLSVEAISLAKAAGVTILTLHPHTTAKMQPLDVGLNAPFKTFYNAAVDSWLMRNQGKNFTIYNVAECVGSAYLKAMTPINIVKAFKKCGIHPFDENIFTEIDFLPSSVTDRPEQLPQDEISDAEVKELTLNRASTTPLASTVRDRPEQLPQDETTDAEDEEPTQQRASTTLLPSSVTDRPDQQGDITVAENEHLTLNRADSPSLLPPVSSPNDSIAPQIKDLNSSPKTYNSKSRKMSTAVSDSQMPTTSNVSKTFISPKVFRPHLKAGPRKGIKRKAGRSIIATDTPEKNAIEEKKNNSKKEIKKKAKKVKHNLFKENKKEKKAKDSDTSESDEFVASGSSSGGEIFISDDEEVLSDFLPLERDPEIDEYVIVEFMSKNMKVYYVAKVLEKIDDDQEDSDFFVSFLKLKNKAQQKFFDPIDIETGGVKSKDIKYILPAPKVEGTSRRKTTLKFHVDMSLLNLRY